MADAAFVRNFDRVAPSDELPFFLRDFKVHLWNSHDVEGRPFGELLASDAARAGVEFEVRPAKYPGIRSGLGINLSGLRPMTKYWDEIIADVDFVRRRFVARQGITELTWLQVWQLSKILSGLPSFMYARSGRSETVPVRVSGMFRAIIGIVSVVEGMLGFGTDPMEKATSAPIIDAAEKGGFLSAGGRACAGPLHMVQSFTDAVLFGAKSEVPSAIEELVGDVDQFFEYGETGILWDLANQLYRASTRQLGERAIELFRRIERHQRPASPRVTTWAHVHSSAVVHLDLGWFSIAETTIRSDQVAAAVPLIERFLGAPPADPPPPGQTEALAGAVAAVLPFAAAEDVRAVSTCWSEYLGLEQRMAGIYLMLQEKPSEGLRALGGGRSPLCHSSGPYWITHADYTKRLGATLGSVLDAAFGVVTESTADGDCKIAPAGRALGEPTPN